MIDYNLLNWSPLKNKQKNLTKKHLPLKYDLINQIRMNEISFSIRLIHPLNEIDDFSELIITS